MVNNKLRTWEASSGTTYQGQREEVKEREDSLEKSHESKLKVYINSQCTSTRTLIRLKT